MLRIIDRYILATFIRAYLVCFLSLVGLYIVIDAFTKLDEFGSAVDTFPALVQNMFLYYSYRTALFFHRLYGVISLIAAMFTLTWMKRHNEILPLLSCGISAYRLITPVLLAAFVVNLLAIGNQEVIMPRISEQLQRTPDDPARLRITGVVARTDSNGILLSGLTAERAGKKITSMSVMIVPPLVPMGTNWIHLSAQEGIWVNDGHRAGWRLLRTEPAQIANPPSVLTWVGPGEYFLQSNVSFDTMTRSTRWFAYCSTAELKEACKDPTAPRYTEMMVSVHFRFTRVILNVILLFLAVPFVLNSHDRSVLPSMATCLAVCAVFYVVSYGCEHFGNIGVMSPVQAAWAPVIVFSVAAVAVFDTVRT